MPSAEKSQQQSGPGQAVAQLEKETRMSKWQEGPALAVRQLEDGSGYVVDATWPGGEVEQLLGVYVRATAAQSWISEHGDGWLKGRCTHH